MKKNYRLKFTKLDKIRFIGHLDLLKLFQKTIKKSKLPIAYSEGFNPHQKMSFASPLPLGMGSVSELLDITLTEETDCNLVKEKINNNLPVGLEILEVKILDDKEKTAAALLMAGEYKIYIDNTDLVKDSINNILNSSEFIFEKTTKNKTVEQDIRKDIYSIEIIDLKQIKVIISTGSTKNLKPEHLVLAIFKNSGLIIDLAKVKIIRTKLFREDEKKLSEL